MSDVSNLRSTINAFYQAQDQALENRKTSSEPGGDITRALSIIRRILPPLPDTGPLSEWLSQTIAVLESEHQNYCQQEEDLTGCGSATFGELLTRLISLEPTLAMTY
ncbi:hypothetical protein MNBD_NITROSPIRAE01-1354 [hydrothermal vent metagenome]|uniref:Uncharacterized protein n=1 Tax=hydrothermal vent metagenome TaxID=652676 RepID=A0A3B1CMS6_9ZZZZ